jgi:hypothetical protein
MTQIWWLLPLYPMMSAHLSVVYSHQMLFWQIYSSINDLTLEQKLFAHFIILRNEWSLAIGTHPLKIIWWMLIEDCFVTKSINIHWIHPILSSTNSAVNFKVGKCLLGASETMELFRSMEEFSRIESTVNAVGYSKLHGDCAILLSCW